MAAARAAKKASGAPSKVKKEPKMKADTSSKDYIKYETHVGGKVTKGKVAIPKGAGFA